MTPNHKDELDALYERLSDSCGRLAAENERLNRCSSLLLHTAMLIAVLLMGAIVFAAFAFIGVTL